MTKPIRGASLEGAPDIVLPEPNRPAFGPGTVVEVTRGDVPRDDNPDKGERSARGVVGVVDGNPYESKEGPNDGKVVQPIREQGTGKLLGVPVDNLRVRSRISQRSFSFQSPDCQANWEKIFGGKR